MADHAQFQAEVLTPEGLVFSGEVEMVSTRTEVGEIGVLANHTPLLAMLAPADLRLHTGGGEVQHYAQGEGFIQVHSNHVLVLVEDCHEPSWIDQAEQEERLEKAQSAIDELHSSHAEPEESARYQKALRDKRRAETFLRIARGE
jgi:F-type H+-transporting ATPase subunit epsilon